MFIQPFTWVTSVTCIRLSCLLLYNHLFPGGWFRLVNFIDIVTNIGFWMGTVIYAILLCQPVSKRWEPETPGYCGSEVKFHYFIATVHMLLDFSVVCRPMPILWRLRIPLRQRVMLTGMFGMGIGSVPSTFPT